MGAYLGSLLSVSKTFETQLSKEDAEARLLSLDGGHFEGCSVKVQKSGRLLNIRLGPSSFFWVPVHFIGELRSEPRAVFSGRFMCESRATRLEWILGQGLLVYVLFLFVREVWSGANLEETIYDYSILVGGVLLVAALLALLNQSPLFFRPRGKNALARLIERTLTRT